MTRAPLDEGSTFLHPTLTTALQGLLTA